MVVKAASNGEVPDLVTSPAVGGRRRTVLEAATQLFAERGFGAVSVQEIADAAGTHKTTVLYHFPTKDALHEAVLDEAFGRIAEVMREFLAGEAAPERIAYMLDQIHAFFAGHIALARLLERELLEPSGDEAHLRRFVETIYMPAVTSLERAVAEERVRPVDPALFIHDLHVQIIGYFCHSGLIQRLGGTDPLSIEALIARRNHLVDQIARQLGIEEARP
jgi:AcrR family transcriptional regulator